MNIKKFNVFKRCKNVVKKITTPGESLSEKAVKGGFWVFSLRITDRIFQLTRTIILARLLSPNDFGVFGIALLVLSTLDTFSQAGFQQALIQKKGETRSYLDTAWTVGLIRGFIIAGVVFFLAKPAAVFFEAPAAENILRIIGISIILQSLNNIAVLYFQKELQFHKFFKYQFLGTIVDVSVAITFAFLLKSVWALVFGLLAGNLVRCIMSYVIEPYRPRFQFDRAKAKELFEFGRWILGSSILIFLITQGDDIFVGKLLGATMLGFYQMAYRISNLPATEISHVISQVSFPAYSKLQSNLPKLREAYLKILQLTAFISFPIAGLIFILAPEFTQIFLGDKWMPMVPAMQVLAFFGAVRSIVATSGSLFQGAGHPKFIYKASWIKLFCLILIIYPLTKILGITGTALAITLPSMFTLVYVVLHTLRIIKCQTYVFLKLLFYPIIGTIIMSGILLSIQSVLRGRMILFISNILLGIFIYLSFLIIVDRKSKNYKLLKNLFNLFDYQIINKSKKEK